MLMFAVLMAGLFVVPILHWWIRRTKCWGVRTIIAGLVFAPGLCVTAWVVWLYIGEFDPFGGGTRWKVVCSLQGAGALRCLAAISGITATYLGVCLLLERFPRRAVRDEEGAVRVVGTWRALVAIQLVLVGGAAYLYTYNTLGDAVSSDNLALAERRLNWNLEGLGPNSGLMVRRSASVLERHPLLPVAVKNGNYDMVRLLVMHGAELSPKYWDDGLGLPSRVYIENPFYFAVRNHDIEMIDFLIDLGVQPEQGIFAALVEHDQELLDFFLEKGASLEFALGVAERMGYKRQHIDKLFSEHTPKIGVEADQ